MAESEEERAKRELREAVRRAIEEPDYGMAAPQNPAMHDAQARGGAEMASDKSKDS
jgi:hypothetical protein